MRRVAAIITGLALAVAMLAAPRMTTEARGQASPPQSKAFGKTLTEWMQLYWTWFYGGGEDHVGNVKFLPLPDHFGDPVGGSFTYADPGTLVGHVDVTLKPGTPFVLPVLFGTGETFEPALGYPDDLALPAEVFTDPSNLITVYIDGKPVMDSTRASVSPFYYGPAPISVTYPEPTPYGAIGAILVQGIGFVHPPLSVGTHTIELVSGARASADLLKLYTPIIQPEGFGVVLMYSWTITVSPK
jgi:hypothetical protein